MKNTSARLRRTGCLLAAGILFLIFLIPLNQIQKTKLLENEGRNFDKAVVTQVMEDNTTDGGNTVGHQTVRLQLTSGEHKGEEVTATSSSSYLFGAHCRKGMHVIALVSQSQGELVASVYSVDRGMAIYVMIAIFLLCIVLIGGKKGLASVLSLLFTFVCVLFLFLPLIYRGFSPIAAAILVVVLTTAVTMLLVDGVTRKSFAATVGTVLGVGIAGAFAWIFGRVTEISGYNVSDIEDLIYVEQMTDIRIGELLFAGILIAALGAVMDVGMSVASTIHELHQTNSSLSRTELFRSGMNVGRDMMGTMSNTLILAFTGGSINTLVFLYAYDYQYLQLVNMYSVGIELMQGIAASMGVILAVPTTAFVAAWLFGRPHPVQKEQGVK